MVLTQSNYISGVAVGLLPKERKYTGMANWQKDHYSILLGDSNQTQNIVLALDRST
jgi:hypothetical protein